ncbi:hypothetical protein EAI_00959, partial [Harpegnathos saltator]
PLKARCLKPLDFFLWGYIKNKVYFTKPRNLDEFQQQIIGECAAIPS